MAVCTYNPVFNGQFSVISCESWRGTGTYYQGCSSTSRLFTHFSNFVLNCQCSSSLSAGKIEIVPISVLVQLGQARAQARRRTEKQFSCNWFSSSDLNTSTKTAPELVCGDFVWLQAPSNMSSCPISQLLMFWQKQKCLVLSEVICFLKAALSAVRCVYLICAFQKKDCWKRSTIKWTN